MEKREKYTPGKRNERIREELQAALLLAEEHFDKDLRVAPAWVGHLSEEFKVALDTMSEKSQQATTGFTNLITALAIKAVYGDQVDIRYHQKQIQHLTNMPAGFNFRGVSESVVAPWLTGNEFVTAKSGWQSRTYERPKPYTLNYDENIEHVKEPFLLCYAQVEEEGQDPHFALAYLFLHQMRLRESMKMVISVPNTKDVLIIAGFFHKHFSYGYKNSTGASRLPVLALYAIYVVLLRELARYEKKKLKPLEEHSAADSQTGATGDIEVINGDGTVYESIEVKHGVPITAKVVDAAFRKIMVNRADRYYILTTHPACDVQSDAKELLSRAQNLLGCQIIVNGVLPSMKYYLRLLSNPADVFPVYRTLLEADRVISYEHKEVWNRITLGEV